MVIILCDNWKFSTQQVFEKFESLEFEDFQLSQNNNHQFDFDENHNLGV